MASQEAIHARPSDELKNVGCSSGHSNSPSYHPRSAEILMVCRVIIVFQYCRAVCDVKLECKGTRRGALNMFANLLKISDLRLRCS